MFRKVIASLLIIVLCLALISGCAGESAEAKPKEKAPAESNTQETDEIAAEDEPLPDTSLPVEINEGTNSVSYPYIIRTDFATWYISKADMELMGEKEYFSGLEGIIGLADEDFAEAQEVFEGYLNEPVQPVDIYTDFSAKTEVAHSGRPLGAIYRMSDRRIFLYRSWMQASFSLLHEYIHYLSITCADLGLESGFWAEGIAEYVSIFVCKNRLIRSINFSLGEEDVAFYATKGVCNEDGSFEPKKYYYGYSARMHIEENIGEEYFSVTGYTMTLRDSQQQHPLMSSVSYFEAASFLEYLVENYGKDTVFSHLDAQQEDFESVYGKDFGTLFLEWAQYDLELCETLGIKLD